MEAIQDLLNYSLIQYNRWQKFVGIGVGVYCLQRGYDQSDSVQTMLGHDLNNTALLLYDWKGTIVITPYLS